MCCPTTRWPMRTPSRRHPSPRRPDPCDGGATAGAPPRVPEGVRSPRSTTRQPDRRRPRPRPLSRRVPRLFPLRSFGSCVLAALAGLVVTDVWLFVPHGVAQAVRQAMYEPSVFLVMFGLIVLSAAFHETGHAAACRYSGADPGKMGCGLYLAWPAFYTDVTDAYRLGRRGRLRTDLGGVYFNVLFALGTTATYLVTRAEPLLLVIVLQHVEIAHQLLPLLRLDGYYIVSDLVGVPDLFTRLGAILASLLPWRWSDPRVRVLKGRVRVIVTAWVLVVVPFLLFNLGLILAHLPRIFATAWDSSRLLYRHVSGAFAAGRPVAAGAGMVQLLALCLPLAA